MRSVLKFKTFPAGYYPNRIYASSGVKSQSKLPRRFSTVPPSRFLRRSRTQDHGQYSSSPSARTAQPVHRNDSSGPIESLNDKTPSSHYKGNYPWKHHSPQIRLNHSRGQSSGSTKAHGISSLKKMLSNHPKFPCITPSNPESKYTVPPCRNLIRIAV